MSQDAGRGGKEDSPLVQTVEKPHVFLDYGGLIVNYDFNSQTLLRAHVLALKEINRASKKKVDLEQLSRAHNIEIQTYLAFRNQDHKEMKLSDMVSSILE